MRTPLYLLALASFGNAATLQTRGPQCSDIIIPVYISAENLALPTTLTATNLETLINSIGSSIFDLGTNLINGTYNIAATYCEPEVYVESRAKTIQLLVHGITYDRHYWDGFSGFDGGKYSWRDYSSKQGYPTLAIDRLGNGISDHPDGILVVQLPAAVEVAHSLTLALKEGQIGGRAFEKVIYVGHSYGSLIGNAHSANYPEDCASYILTGYTDQVKPSIPTVVLGGPFLPAAMVDAAKYGSLPVSYVTESTKAGFDSLFFVKSKSDPNLRAYNFANRGTATLGEAVSAYLANDIAATYTGPVYDLTGERDAIFCSADGLGLGTLLGIGNCGSGSSSLPAKTGRLYPAARTYGYSIPKGIGHCNILHFGAQEQFKDVHDWLAAEGF